MVEQDNTIKKVTIYDIAKKVGTSVATVSRVLSNSNYPVSKEIRQKILDAANKMNYSPNLLGRMLKKSESKDIGVIIPTISNPFYPQLILGIETEARKLGFNIILCNSFRDVSNEKKYIDFLYQKQIKGIILSSIGEDHGFINNYCANGLKIVGFDQNLDDFKCNKVSFNFTGGGMMAVDYLVKMGHEKIAFASAPLTRNSRKDIFMGYKLGLMKYDIKFSENNIYISKIEKEVENGTYEFETGVELAKECIQSANIPTAIFAMNDMTAIGIMQGLINNGVKVPEDISIIGFDNIDFSVMVNPSLTTINQPAFETGKLACKILIENIMKDGNDFFSIMLEPSLIERRSVRNLIA
jgi:LacI family transcriptional regulator